MSSEIHRKLFTSEAYLQMAEVGILSPTDRVELIGGEVLVMSPTGQRHFASVTSATRELIRAIGDQALLSVQSTVVLDKFAVPEPDFGLLKPKADFYSSKHPGPEDILLLIEVADSSLNYDMTVKLSLYAIMSVPEYWIVDLRNDRLLVYSQPHGDSYQISRELHHGDSAELPGIPGCRLSVDAFLP